MNKIALLLVTIITFFASSSILWACHRPTFSLRYEDSYENAMTRYLRAGGSISDGIALVDDIDDILEMFPKRNFPSHFKYGKKTRNAYAYKFGLSQDCELRISRYEYKHRRDPARNVHHHLVGHGNTVYSAGAIFFFHNGKNIKKVVISNRSSRYCPSYQSLKNVVDYLRDLGIPLNKIMLVNDTRENCLKEVSL